MGEWEIMRILKVAPEREPEVTEISGTLESMQELVCGLIQVLYPFDEAVALIANDEGKVMSLPLNRALRNSRTGEVYDIIAGTFFLCGAPPDSKRFTSLSEEQVWRYTQMFSVPELFVNVNGKLLILPMAKVSQ